MSSLLNATYSFGSFETSPHPFYALFYRWGNWGNEGIIIFFLKNTWQSSINVGIQALAVWFQNLSSTWGCGGGETKVGELGLGVSLYSVEIGNHGTWATKWVWDMRKRFWGWLSSSCIQKLSSRWHFTRDGIESNRDNWNGDLEHVNCQHTSAVCIFFLAVWPCKL